MKFEMSLLPTSHSTRWIMLAALSVSITATGVAAEPNEVSPLTKPRLLILTDLGADPDDEQSLVRLLVHANEFEIEGLIATSAATTPNNERWPDPRPELITRKLEAYREVLPNLSLHASGYPAAEDLMKLVKTGNRNRGQQFVGPEHSTEGAQWIIDCLDRDDPRPLNVCFWGGQTDFAQALWQVKQDRGPQGLANLTKKIRVYSIGDQDHIFDWMIKEFPIPHYVLAKTFTGHSIEGAYRGMYLGGNQSLTSLDWLDKHVRKSHGPLGALYPPLTSTSPNPNKALKEGDTPSWLAFLPFGLDNPEHPEWGGWGGRYVRNEHGIYRDSVDQVGEIRDARASVWRWRSDIQNEFQARMDWCVKPYSQANHPPVAVLNGKPGNAPLSIHAVPGAAVTVTSSGSSDPDGNVLTSNWMIYPEAGTYEGKVELQTTPDQATLTVPNDAAGKIIHMILSLQDNGVPPLTRYRRAVIAISQSNREDGK